MKEKLENLIATLPDHPGVYLMKDAEGTVIYVGKAISLKNRVRQYFRGRHPGQPKVDAMVEHIESFDYVLVDSELKPLSWSATSLRSTARITILCCGMTSTTPISGWIWSRLIHGWRSPGR